jgi:hypothetical protein
VFGFQGVQFFNEEAADFFGVLQQPFFFDDGEARKPARHGKVVFAERVGMHDASVHTRKHLVVDRAFINDGARLHHAAAQGLR